MTCNEFEKITSDLACNYLIDAVERETGLVHASTCARCAQRLTNERDLNVWLRTLQRAEQNAQAPLRIKQELLETFVERHNTTKPSVVVFPRQANWARLALAAAIAIMFAVLFLPKALRTARPKTGEVAKDQNIERNNAPVKPPTLVSKVNENISKPSTTKFARSAKTHVASMARTSRKRAVSRTRYQATEIAANETKTDFIPLTYLNKATAMEGGIIVRVEVSREKLVSMGLPLNLERAGERISADIILGDDGVVRALRLVQ